ncbi:NPCBM/NEW2 domain-containing protein [Paenibacillus sp. GCM10027628]|uniref:NPCBM/NEW2 domain-containing protein n=1 Tax=Paenibacillus sp. GCM10027628 TaxID=3273413 RepID=UPI0036302CE6
MRRFPLFILVIALIASTTFSFNLTVTAAAGQYVFEAESMALTNFTTGTVTYMNYVNNQPLETMTFAQGVSGQTSTASAVFNGLAGNYDIITRFVGQVQNGVAYTISINGNAVDQWGSSQRYGTNYTDPRDIDNHTTSKVALHPGDVMKLTAVSASEVPRVDKLTVQTYQGPPASTLTIDSPNATLNNGFNWAKNRALGLAFYPGNPMLGHESEWWRLADSTHSTLTPGYWGAYVNRESFYNRDISHQSDAGHLLGLDNETFNMMKLFAGDSTISGQNGWPLWAHSSYGIMYYIDGTGFKELPSPFDVMHKAYQQYLWTGNTNWINDPTLSAYYDSTIGPFLTNHGVVWNDANPASEQPVVKMNSGEFTPTYFEFTNDNLVSAGDSLGLEYQSLLAYAGILKAKGNTSGSTLWQNRAQRLKDYYEAHWYDASTGRYIRGFDATGNFKSDWGHESSFFMPLKGLGDFGSRTNAYLDYINANDAGLNVEATTYLPEMFYNYNRSVTGWSWLSKILTEQNTYPEVAFTAISNIIDGMMGVQPDAPNNKVSTISRLTTDVPWVEMNHIKVGANDLKIKHNGVTNSTLTNNSGGTITWEAQFYGTPSTIYVNGVANTPQTKSLYGQTISYVDVQVNSGAVCNVGPQIVDYQAPTAPTNLQASNLTQTGVQLNWTASTDDVGIAGYDVYSGSTIIGSTNSTSYAVSGLAAQGTSYTFTVKARDAAGNVSPASNAINVTTPIAQQVYLSDLNWVSATAGSGTVQKDKSMGGNTITLNGTTYTKGLGTHAISNITYNLNGQYSWFQSFIGVDDEVSSNATVVFQVWADGNKIYDSQTMTPTSATKSIDISVAGVNQLVLTVTDAGDGINSDHADWPNAQLFRSGSGSDTQAPTAPANLATSNITQNSVQLSWTASTDNVGVTGYDIYKGAALAGTSTTTSFNVSGLTAGTAYSFTVKAKDAAGNLSTASNTVNITTQSAQQQGTVYLSDMTWASATTGWGTVQKDKSVGGNTITLNGTTYTKGLGTHAISNITYNLNGQYSRFQSDVGVDDEVGANSTVIFQVWADGNKIYDSGVMTPTSATKSIDVSVAGVNQLVLTVTDAGDGINSDHADWANARLQTPTSTYLSDLAWASATTGWGTAQKDKSVGGNTITLNGTTYTKGLGTHAISDITYNLNGQYSRFKSDVGVDDEVSANSTVVFQVWADGNKIYDSGVMNPTSATKTIDISVAGVNQLKLTVTDAGDGINSDHADWAGTMVTN